jgi:hypothetical protein
MTTEAEHFPLVDENGRRYRLHGDGHRQHLLVEPEPFGPVDDDPRAPALLVRARCGARGCKTELLRVYLSAPDSVTVRTIGMFHRGVKAADGTREPADRHRLASENVIPVAELCDLDWELLCDDHGERALDGTRLVVECRRAARERVEGKGPRGFMLADPAPGN